MLRQKKTPPTRITPLSAIFLFNIFQYNSSIGISPGNPVISIHFFPDESAGGLAYTCLPNTDAFRKPGHESSCWSIADVGSVTTDDLSPSVLRRFRQIFLFKVRHRIDETAVGGICPSRTSFFVRYGFPLSGLRTADRTHRQKPRVLSSPQAPEFGTLGM